MNRMSHAPPAQVPVPMMGYRINDQIGIAKFYSTSTRYFTGHGAGTGVDQSGNLGIS
jgi:hypothetical protein